MLFKKKNLKKEEKSLRPVLHVTDSLKTYQQDLVQNEVTSLKELSLVSSSFGNVLAEAETFQTTLQDFDQTFSNINQVSGQFAAVGRSGAERCGRIKEQHPAGRILFRRNGQHL